MLPLHTGDSLNVTCTVSSLPQLSHFQVDVFALMDLNSTTLAAAGGRHSINAELELGLSDKLKILDVDFENAADEVLNFFLLLRRFVFINSADEFLEHSR